MIVVYSQDFYITNMFCLNILVLNSNNYNLYSMDFIKYYCMAGKNIKMICINTELRANLTFTNLHSRESEKAGNISSYFWRASY